MRCRVEASSSPATAPERRYHYYCSVWQPAGGDPGIALPLLLPCSSLPAAAHPTPHARTRTHTHLSPRSR